VLEESLLEFPGALVLVTHDRYLLDRVSTSLLALDGQGGLTYYADYAQWEAAQRAVPSARAEGKRAAKAAAGEPADKPKKLGYHEKREWEQMETRILEAERRVEKAQEAAADPAVASDHKALAERLKTLAGAQAAVEELYARWAELEQKVKA
jgi:ATP-binding cassette subfamily F protein uup